MTASAFDIPGGARGPETAGIQSAVTLATSAARPLRPSPGPGPLRPGRRPSETLP